MSDRCVVIPFPVRREGRPYAMRAAIRLPDSSRLQGLLTAAGLLLPIWAPLALALLRR